MFAERELELMEYDVALSFAGEDRSYVQKVAEVLHALGIKVFYDKYEEVDMWGKNLYTHLDDVYRKKSRYCVIFISKHYKEKLWTNHERQSAQARAFHQREEYILPVRFDETEIPGVLPTTVYIAVEDRKPEELATLIANKVNPEIDVELMLDYLQSQLPNYIISIDNTNVVFECSREDYYGEFPIRLLLEMYKLNMLDYMFLLPAIVPH